jgi:hydroxypyruvate isomerase
MPRFAANLSMLWNELPFLERFEAASKAGFKAVEFLFPYDHPAETIAHLLKQHGLELVLHNLPPGDWAAGERGIACIPGREDEFRAGVAKAAAYAPVIGVQRWHCMAGLMPAGVSEAQAMARQYSVPVVVEVILEKVTNIAMGTEINAINEFEDIECLHPEGREGLIAAGLLE